MKLWWDTTVNTRQKLVFQVIPNIILWFLWKRRNTVIHGGSYSVSKAIWDVNNMVQKFMMCRFGYKDIPTTWPLMVALLDDFRPCFKSRCVRWYPPNEGWSKVNTDGASKGNSGPSAIAFCIRDNNGDLVGAKGVKIPDTTNLTVEVVAIREGLIYCCEKNYTHIIVETDSLARVHMLNGVWDTPWNVVLETSSINRMRDLLTLRVQHSLKEGNTLADYFTNLIFDFAELEHLLLLYQGGDDNGSRTTSSDALTAAKGRAKVARC
ncbi:hypothetical protein MTR67_025468 [Solanum verrucosum]|uniref:RNase H type-1 domain-containing protein n=1 Tax=Solanum verrucosum TaxID=315347 RepID=A0AAF0QZU2_SOLVR|nr:hypothetical protein MTR67_025468 [Solanum verrucosum]